MLLDEASLGHEVGGSSAGLPCQFSGYPISSALTAEHNVSSIYAEENCWHQLRTFFCVNANYLPGLEQVFSHLGQMVTSDLFATPGSVTQSY